MQKAVQSRAGLTAVSNVRLLGTRLDLPRAVVGVGGDPGDHSSAPGSRCAEASRCTEFTCWFHCSVCGLEQGDEFILVWVLLVAWSVSVLKIPTCPKTTWLLKGFDRDFFS